MLSAAGMVSVTVGNHDVVDVSGGKLSMDSPMARALLGKAIDDEISVHSPSGEQHYVITAIRYGDVE